MILERDTELHGQSAEMTPEEMDGAS